MCVDLQHTPSMLIHQYQPQSLPEPYELLRSQGLCEYISDLIRCGNIIQLEGSLLDFLAYPMMSDSNMLQSSMEDGIFGKGDCYLYWHLRGCICNIR